MYQKTHYKLFATSTVHSINPYNWAMASMTHSPALGTDKQQNPSRVASNTLRNSE